MLILGWVPALVVFLVKSNSPWLRNEAAKVFNFNFAIAILELIFMVFVIAGAIADVASAILCMSILIFACIYLFSAIYIVINSIRVSSGKDSSYPFEVPILKVR